MSVEEAYLGLRGPQPHLKLRSNPLTDLTPPDWLGEVARAYWNRHADQLARNKLLTAQTADAFALHCDLWGRLQAMRTEPTTRAYLDTFSKFTASSKLFRLVPNEKPQVKESRYEDFAEVEFE
jgi:hypothetical protein